MSVVYSGGNSATAIAGITAAIYARISTAADGKLVLDSASMDAWLRAEFNLLATEGSPPGGAAAVQAVVDGWSFGGHINTINDLLFPATFAERADWPGDASTIIGDRAEKLLTQQSGIERAVRTLQAHVDTTKRTLLDQLAGEYERFIAPYLTLPVLRAVETRAYIATYVTDRGEESAPSEASALVDLDQNDSTTVVVPAPPSGRFITHFRLYRSSVGDTGAAFQLVPGPTPDGFPVGTLTVTDAVEQGDLQEPNPTGSWAEPPEMDGIVNMPNGVIMGWKGTQLYFCEPYFPHAWPVEYQQPVGHRVVGAGVLGQTAVVLTDGVPYYVSGADSASMTVQRVESRQSCVSKRCIVDAEGGLIYTSPDGVCLATPSGIEVITRGVVSRDTWQALAPQDAIAGYQDGLYHLFFANGGLAASVDLVSRRISTFNQQASAVYTDLKSDALYVVSTAGLLPMFSASPPNEGRWRSRIVVTSEYPAFTAIRVESAFDYPVQVILYADGAVWANRVFTTPLFRRLPPGRFREIEVEVVSRARVTKVVLASSVRELAQ